MVCGRKLIEMLKRLVRYFMATGSKCLRCLMFIFLNSLEFLYFEL